MSPDAAVNGRPVYVSDLLAIEQRLLARIDRLEDNTNHRLEALDTKLDTKADAGSVARLTDRVAALEANQLRWSIPRLVGGAFVLAVVSALAGALVTRAVGGG